MTYPAKYRWLADCGQLPRAILECAKLDGVAEIVGRGSNRTIISWRDELNQAGVAIAGYSDDDIPWCGLFAAIVVHRAAKRVVANPLWAKNWAKFGTGVAAAGLGDVLVFERPGGGGHVGFYVAEDASAFHVWGGNQANKVCITRIGKNRCIAIRRPVYNAKPDSVKPYKVAATGGLSGNEA